MQGQAFLSSPPSTPIPLPPQKKSSPPLSSIPPKHFPPKTQRKKNKNSFDAGICSIARLNIRYKNTPIWPMTPSCFFFYKILYQGGKNCLKTTWDLLCAMLSSARITLDHRKRMETEAKAEGVASVLGAEFIPFLAALAVLPQLIGWIQTNISNRLSNTLRYTEDCRLFFRKTNPSLNLPDSCC